MLFRSDDEYIDVMETIDWLESVLADEQKVLNIIKEDLLEMKKKFGDARRTILSHDTSSMDMEDLIAEEDIVITISHQGYIKRQTLDNFRNQKRGFPSRRVPASGDRYIHSSRYRRIHTGPARPCRSGREPSPESPGCRFRAYGSQTT